MLFVGTARCHTVPPGAVAPVAGCLGTWIAAAGTAFCLLNPNGITRWLATPEDHPGRSMLMNDGVAEPWGSFWAGSMAYDNTPNAGTLYRVDNDGTVIPPSAAAWASATPTAPSTTTPAFLRRAVAFFTAQASTTAALAALPSCTPTTTSTDTRTRRPPPISRVKKRCSTPHAVACPNVPPRRDQLSSTTDRTCAALRAPPPRVIGG